MLAGEGAVAIWNGIADEGRAEFYSWHLHEHMPERLGIPGFVRGRRYRSVDAGTQPEFFTLYETQTFEVTVSSDYTNRLNAPTEWTKLATSHFRTTSRALMRVVASFGVGPGGLLATLRFDIDRALAASTISELKRELLRLAERQGVTGAHLLRTDDDASEARTAETRDRTDIETPPRWAILLEGCTTRDLDLALTELHAFPALGKAAVGRYIHEHTRLKTAWAIG